jgi:putative oxidoreductase
MTADPDRVKAIFSDPDKFVTADEFLFMLTAIIVLIFGPGKFSLDWLIGKKFFKSSGKTEKT